MRDFLQDLEVNGESNGWVEYNDGGVWIKDKGVEVLMSKVQEYMTFVIGEDQEQIIDGLFDTKQIDIIARARNELRAEQRGRL